MADSKGWLEKVLDEASADVKTWPNWLRDKDIETRNDTAAEGQRASPAKYELQSKKAEGASD
jgi:hypothetical protein